MCTTRGSVDVAKYMGTTAEGESPEQAESSSPQIAQETWTAFVMTPDGVKGITQSEFSTLKQSIQPKYFNVIVSGSKVEILHRNKQYGGELKRVIVPLLRLLLRSPGEMITGPKLVEEIWGNVDYDQKARTRLKVAISRLRTLLGPDGKLLKTQPGKGPNRAHKTGYSIDKGFAFLWLETTQRD